MPSSTLCYEKTKAIFTEFNKSFPLNLLSHFIRVRLCETPEMAAHQAPPSLGSPGKSIGVGCHFLLQCRKVKSESEVAQSCPTLSNLMDCSPSGSPSLGSPGKNTGVGCHFLLKGIFPTQGSNPGLPHCGQMLYRLSHQGKQMRIILSCCWWKGVENLFHCNN